MEHGFDIDFYRVGRGDALSPLPSVGKVYF